MDAAQQQRVRERGAAPGRGEGAGTAAGAVTAPRPGTAALTGAAASLQAAISYYCREGLFRHAQAAAEDGLRKAAGDPVLLFYRAYGLLMAGNRRRGRGSPEARARAEAEAPCRLWWGEGGTRWSRAQLLLAEARGKARGVAGPAVQC